MTDRSNASVISLLVLPFPGNPEQRAVKCVCVCVFTSDWQFVFKICNGRRLDASLGRGLIREDVWQGCANSQWSTESIMSIPL